MLRRQQMLPPESAASLLCASCASSLPLVYQSLSLIPLSRPPLTAPDSVSLVSLTGRMQRLRRSFSLDFVNDDTATVFLNDDPDHEPSGGRGSGSHHNHHHSLTTDPKCLLMFPLTAPYFVPDDSRIRFHHQQHPFTRQFANPCAFPDSAQQFHLNSSGTSANGVSLPLTSSPSNHHSGISHSGLSWDDASPEIDDDLAADFDGSLSGLGMEVGSSTYNMSEALMALPTLKNEHFSSSRNHREYDASAHSNADSDVRPVAIVHGKKNRLALGHDEESSVSTGIKRVCISNDREVSNAESRFSVSTANSSTRDSMFECNHEDCVNSLRCSRHSNSAPELRPAHQNSSDSSPSPTSPSALTAMLSGSNSDDGPTDARRKRPQDCSFAYTLQAATSVATKVNEETMTYLNQGQSYEIKLKKKSGQAGKKVRTIVRVGFYERRLQYMETVLIEQWRASRRSERILEVDVPLSYGISDIINDAVDINKCSFVWDTAKDCGIFIKVNCISTEFTPKKHGGEKGVPFRIIIETHSLIPSGKTGFETILHAASSQVKVFKPKGADRKHKTDREKLMRKGNQEAEKFRASYDYTKFTECSTDQIYVTTTPANITHSRHSSIGSQNSPERHVPAPDMVDSPLDFTSARLVIEDVKSPSTPTAAAPVSRFSVSPLSQAATSTSPSALSPQPLPSSFLRADATAAEAAQWLMTCRFEKYVKTFAHFSGSDILRLTRSDLIQICDLTDGIRLYNSLHCQSLRPRSTIYVSTSPNEDFSAIYLESLTAQELKSKLCNLLSSNMSNGCNGKSSNGTASQPVVSISRMRMAGPAGIFIAVTDDVVRNIPHEAMFMLDFEKDGPNFKASLRNYK